MKAIVIMAKEPRPGLVKTRMVSDLDPIAVSKIYLGFLMDRIQQVREILDVDHYIAYTPGKAVDFFKEMALESFNLIPQNGRDLGERLSNISHQLFDKGYKKIAIMDSDSPNLPSRFITSSFFYLDSSDIVLGPCEDGGYYLIGLSHDIPEIFADIPWSTSEVVAVTKERANSEGKSIKFLEKWYDVDTKDDLARLKNDLDVYSDNSNDMYFCNNTYNIISKFDIR
jgi:rSAM/selenodomain-associated transferase 1